MARTLLDSLGDGYERRSDRGFAPGGGADLRRLVRDTAPDRKRRLRTDPPAWYCHEP
jgi:hypothetical protein